MLKYIRGAKIIACYENNGRRAILFGDRHHFHNRECVFHKAYTVSEVVEMIIKHDQTWHIFTEASKSDTGVDKTNGLGVKVLQYLLLKKKEKFCTS